MTEIKDFINPTSMLTPGIAGGLSASVAMPLVVHFDLKYPWVALIISFIISITIVLAFEEKTKLSLRCLFCILNTLIIFSVSVGAGVTVNSPPEPPPAVSSNVSENQTLSTVNKVLSTVNGSFFIGSANAQEEDDFEARIARQLEQDGASAAVPAKPSANPTDRSSDSNSPRALDRDQEAKYREALKKYHRRWSF